MRFNEKVDAIQEMTVSHVKRNHILKMLKDESTNAAKVDLSIFKKLELNLSTEHQAQVDAAV